MKKLIAESARNYMSANGLSQAQLAEATGINVSYINAMLSGAEDIDVAGRKVSIKTPYYAKLADQCGYIYEKRYWATIETDQYLLCSTELADGKMTGRMKLIVGESGCGKTFSVNKFLKEAPVGTYRLTVSSLYSIKDILAELCLLVGIQAKGSNAIRVKRIAEKLNVLKMKGYKPMIILDEAENLRPAALKMLKSLYDNVREYCAIALIGTPQLLHKLETLKDKDHDGMPQFYRRFKAGIRELPLMKKETFTEFFDELGVEDEGLRDLLTSLCSNFGEMNDYLEPALREADKNGVALTEKRFRMMYGLGRG